MKILIVFLLSCTSLFAGETFVSIKSGESNHVSYGLSYMTSDARSAANLPPSDDFADLCLTLRNGGTKSMSFGEITAKDFSVRDADGQEMTIYLRTSSQDVTSLAYGDATIIHLMVMLPHARKYPQPWTFHFKNQPGEHNYPLDLMLTGIKLPRR